MKKSKFIGKTYGRWLVAEMFLAANYDHGTKHNAYRYELVRLTSDMKCLRKMTVSGSTMTKIANGIVDADEVAARKEKSLGPRNTTYYTFLTKHK